MASGSSTSSGTSKSNDDSKWYFTAEQLTNSPSRKCGMDADQELMYRQRAANLIQDMGQRLQVSQLCINTAIVYMHRFYAFHSFTQFHRNSIAAAALFLAAKVEEQPRKLEHIIKVVHICLGLDAPDPVRESYAEQAQDLVFNENVLLQTLGFDVAIDHPHTHVVKTCHLVKASKDLAQTSYFMASNSLHLTTMCLQYKPTVVACFCIHLACKWSRWEIPQSNEGRHWFHYVDKTVTLDLLKQLTDEFLHIFDRCPTRLKSKVKSIRADQAPEESGRRTGSSSGSGSNAIMPAPSTSSSVSRGGPEEGGSSATAAASSHHRSLSSSSSHSHTKQNPDQLKQHKLPSNSSSSRSRSDRPPHSGSSGSGQQPQQPHYGSSSSSSKPAPPSSSMSAHRSGMQQQPLSGGSGSSSNSQRGAPGYSSSGGSNVHDGNKNRPPSMLPPGGTGANAPAAAAGGPSSVHSGYNQQKPDRHGGQKGPLKPQSSSSSSSSSSTGAPYSGSGGSSSNSGNAKQPSSQQSSLFTHPPSYNQSISGRGGQAGAPNLSSNEQQLPAGSAPPGNHQQKASHSQSGSDSSSFRLLDDSIGRLNDQMQMCTPPKQSKPSSIFSPDWKDSQNEQMPAGGGKSRQSASGHYGNSGSTGAERMLKPPKGSPSGKKQLQQQLQQQQQQQQQHASMGSAGGGGLLGSQGTRPEITKKERRSENTASGGGNSKHPSMQMPFDKKPIGLVGSQPTGAGSNSSNNNHSSSNLKRTLDVGPHQASTHPLADAHPSMAMGTELSKAPTSQAPSTIAGSTSNAPTKRPHPGANEQIRQDDGTDFREQKVRKTEPPPATAGYLASTASPSDQLFNSSFDLASTFDKMDDSSLFNFNDPGSLLSQPLLSDSKPSTLAKSGALFSSGAINGIETNPALVSSLLKESLFNDPPKFGSLYGGTGTEGSDHGKPLSDASLLDTKPNVPSVESLLQGATGPGGLTTAANATVSGGSASSYPWVAANATLPVSDAAPTAGGPPAAPMTTATVAPTATTVTDSLTALTAASASDDTDQGGSGHRSKSEKKKKKEKHKHKEKDKTKDRDREEKKKHKKDKDKHRDRDHRGDQSTGGATDASGGTTHSSASHAQQDQPPPGPIKIKLNRSIVEGAAAAAAAAAGSAASGDGLKIKIPKDRLSGASALPPATTTSSTAGSGAGTGSTATGGGSSSLKLKISKDKIEHYNISASDAGGGIGSAAPGYGGGTAGSIAASSLASNPNAGVGGMTHAGSLPVGAGPSSKKKDKDRDKDREKSKSKGDHRQNGSGASAASNASGSNSSKSSSKILSNMTQPQQQYGALNIWLRKANA
uniref:Cyclin-like domain-containing protein n=1 Tax=Anopheles albimanus TaxID=7167 RepID=A0A182FFR0_ANOAL